MREIVQEWVKKGESDFVAAKTLAQQNGLENQTGFHCQQAIVKNTILLFKKSSHLLKGFPILL